jgi:hypothetical protein
VRVLTTDGATVGPNPRLGKRITGLLIAIAAIAALLGASVAGAGLPKEGDWIYDIPTGTVFGKTETAPTIFSAYVEFSGDGTGFIYAFSVVTHGTCTKNGHVRAQIMGGDTPSSRGPGTPGSLKIPVRPDGRFSGTAKVINDKGTATVTGRIVGTKMTGSVKVHVRNVTWGDCKGAGKLVHLHGYPVT